MNQTSRPTSQPSIQPARREVNSDQAGTHPALIGPTIPSPTHIPIARERRFEKSWVGISQVAIDLHSGWMCTGWLAGWLDSLRYRHPTPLVMN